MVRQALQAESYDKRGDDDITSYMSMSPESRVPIFIPSKSSQSSACYLQPRKSTFPRIFYNSAIKRKAN